MNEENSEQNEKCECEGHDWENDKIDLNSIIREGNFLGFPVHCTICGVKAVEWFEYSYTEMEKEDDKSDETNHQD